jgi:hypothetical protein
VVSLGTPDAGEFEAGRVTDVGRMPNAHALTRAVRAAIRRPSGDVV